MSAETFAANAATHSAISTAAERLQRIRERPTPAAEPHHTIGGSDQTETHNRLNRMREGRIGHLNARLNDAEQRAQNDFVFGAQKGRSRAHFNHER